MVLLPLLPVILISPYKTLQLLVFPMQQNSTSPRLVLQYPLRKLGKRCKPGSGNVSCVLNLAEVLEIIALEKFPEIMRKFSFLSAKCVLHVLYMLYF